MRREELLQEFKTQARHLASGMNYLYANGRPFRVRYADEWLLPDEHGIKLPFPEHVPQDVMRGQIDAMVLSLGLHDIDLHNELRPKNKTAGNIFDRLERIRIEVLGVRRWAHMPGLEGNINATFLYRQRSLAGLFRRGNEVERMARHSLMPTSPLSVIAGKLGARSQEAELEKHAADLGYMAQRIESQDAFASAALRFLRKLGYSVDLPRQTDETVEIDLTGKSEDPFLKRTGQVLSKLPGSTGEMLVRAAVGAMNFSQKLIMVAVSPFVQLEMHNKSFKILMRFRGRQREHGEYKWGEGGINGTRFSGSRKTRPALSGKTPPALMANEMFIAMGRGGRPFWPWESKPIIFPIAKSTAKDPIQRRIENDAANKANYSIATTANDSEGPLSSYVTSAHQNYRATYQAVRQAIEGDGAVINQLTRQLVNLFPVLQSSYPQIAEDGHRLHPGRLASIITDPTEQTIYLDEVEAQKPPSLAVTILTSACQEVFSPVTNDAQQSRAKCGVPFEYWARTIAAFSGACRKADIPVEILYQVAELPELQVDSGGIREEYAVLQEHQILRQLPRNFIGRFTPIHHIVCKDFKNTKFDVADLLARMSLVNEIGLEKVQGNIAGESLLWANDRLLRQPATHRLIIAVGESLPYGHYYRLRTQGYEHGPYMDPQWAMMGMSPFALHLKETVKAITTHSSVGVLHIGSGLNLFSAFEGACFPKSLDVSPINDLDGKFAGQFGAAVREMMSHRSPRHNSSEENEPRIFGVPFGFG